MKDMKFTHLFADMKCPECECINVTTTWETQVVPYGDQGEEISCTVPVRHCQRCKYEWLDYESEEIRDQAVSEVMNRRRH